MIDCGFGRSSDLFLHSFGLPIVPAGTTVTVVYKTVYLSGTHSSGTVQDSHLIPSWPPSGGTETDCKSTTFIWIGEIYFLGTIKKNAPRR